MIIFFAILSLGLLGMIIYFVISPKTSRLHRLAALIALGVIGITILVCGILLIRGPQEDPDAVLQQIFQGTQTQPQPRNIWDIVIFSALLLIVASVAIKAIKDQRKPAAKQKKAAKNNFFDDTDDLELELKEIDEIKTIDSVDTAIDDDDGFDISRG